MLQAALTLLAETHGHGTDLEPALSGCTMLGQPFDLPPGGALFWPCGGLQVVERENLPLARSLAKLGQVVGKGIGINDAAAKAMHRMRNRLYVEAIGRLFPCKQRLVSNYE